MSLQPGTTLGPYSVTAKIGEGGMGEVYRARDTKLDRDVALKVLPQAFTDDPDRLARFEREAKVLASLNHPNIGGIHGLEESEGVRALVLEYIEGPTLADRIKQGPIPVDEALPIAKQIAEALEAAHEAGVIHRDLKPANIKLKPDGTVKVLDFGLARALQPDVMSGDASQSPTLTAAATQAGVILGTAAYMAPEQAKGRSVDKRADVWAFGAVLYEMLAGKRAFAGEDVSDTLATVLKSEPEWDALPANTPPSVRRVVRACLQKNPKQRVHDVADVRLAMEGAFETRVSTPVLSDTSRKTGSRLGWAMGGAVTTAPIVGAVAWTLRPEPWPRLVDNVSVTLPAEVSLPTFAVSFALSPDGRHLALVGMRSDGTGTRLYHRAMDEPDAVVVPGTEGALHPSFSPNGQWIGFWARGSLYRVALAGGLPVIVCEVPFSFPPGWARWGPDDRIWFSAVDGAGLYAVSPSLGVPQVITTIDDEERAHYFAAPLPSGRGVVFTVAPRENQPSQIAVYDDETGKHRTLAEGYQPSWASSGHIVFLRGAGELWAMPFDAETLESTGVPEPVTPNGVRQFKLSNDGTLTYVPGFSFGGSLVWVDREGNEQPVGAAVANYRNPRLSPDDSRVAVEILDDNHDIYLLDLASPTTRTRLTFGPGRDDAPLWTPSGDRIAFRSDRDGTGSVFWKAADGTGQAEPLFSLPDRSVGPRSWTDSGHLVVGSQSQTGPGGDIGVVSIRGEPEVRWVLVKPYSTFDATISPDGRYLAFLSGESGENEVRVRPFPETEEGRWDVEGPGEDPLWSRDGRELFYRTSPITGGRVMAVPVATEPSFELGEPEPLFGDVYWHLVGTNYDVASGGRFLMIKPDESSVAREIKIIRNWTEELKRLVPSE